MNKVFISGSVGGTPQVSYTPKGQRILVFPMWVEEAGFSIEVIFAGEPKATDPASAMGNRILVAGALSKAKTHSRNLLKVKAHKILPMEE